MGSKTISQSFSFFLIVSQLLYLFNKIVHVSIVEKFKVIFSKCTRQKHPSTRMYMHTHTHTHTLLQRILELSLYFYDTISLSKHETIKEKNLVDLTI